MIEFFKTLDETNRKRRLQEEVRRHDAAQTQLGVRGPGSSREDEAPGGRLAPPESLSAPPAVGQQPEEPLPSREATQEPAGQPPDGVEEHLVSLLAPASFEAEQYRALRHTVEQMHRAGGLSLVAVSSPAAGDGKTTTAINLAGTLAQAPEARVLLVEADLRRPSVTVRDQLGLRDSGGPGLADAILDPGLVLEDVVQRHPRFNLSVLPAGWRPTAPYEALKSPRLGDLLEVARQRYDYIILDTPPLLVVPDCRVIGKWVDGFLVVVAANKTPRKLVEEALNVLEPGKLVGLVFNGDDRPLSGYYGYYYAYGQFRDKGRTGGWGRMVSKVGGSLWRRGSSRQPEAR